MKVKIGNTIYDSHDIPIMIILTDQAKININNMPLELMKYCEYPSDKNYSIDDIKNFMKVSND